MHRLVRLGYAGRMTAGIAYDTARPVNGRSTVGFRPFIRWAGGKSGMLDLISGLLPLKWERYFEPMAGGAALFFRTLPARATIADVNGELINFYTALKTRPEALLRRLRGLCASRDLYYQMRRSHPTASLDRAVRFAYLNRLAWNGLYRVNRNGDFNVPIGDRLPIALWDFGDLKRASEALARTSLIQGDFDHVLRYAREGDFVFLDPPYPKGANDTGFNRYSASTFTSSDHIRLSKTIQKLSSRGVKVMLALADRMALRTIYPTQLRCEVVRSKSLIACNGAARRDVGELILMNY
jgi:DNA adenine methylase